VTFDIAWQIVTVSISVPLLRTLCPPVFFLSHYFGSRGNCVSDEHFSKGARSKGYGLVYIRTNYRLTKKNPIAMVTKKTLLTQIISETLYRKLTSEDPTTRKKNMTKVISVL
jgi:hypothetical protein